MHRNPFVVVIVFPHHRMGFCIRGIDYRLGMSHICPIALASNAIALSQMLNPYRDRRRRYRFSASSHGGAYRGIGYR
jgi:hypothetical protein